MKHLRKFTMDAGEKVDPSTTTIIKTESGDKIITIKTTGHQPHQRRLPQSLRQRILQMVGGEGGVSQLLSQIFFNLEGVDVGRREQLLGRYIPGAAGEKVEQIQGDPHAALSLTLALSDGDTCERDDGEEEMSTKDSLKCNYSATVRFVCVLGHVLEQIVSVGEIRTGHFYVVISVPAFCTIDAQLARNVESTFWRPKISCHLLNDDPISLGNLSDQVEPGLVLDFFNYEPVPSPAAKKAEDELVSANEAVTANWISRSLKKAYIEQLRLVLGRDSNESEASSTSDTYPLLRKLMQEFIDAEEIEVDPKAVRDPNSQLPDKLVSKWFEVLDVSTTQADDVIDRSVPKTATENSPPTTAAGESPEESKQSGDSDSEL